MALFRLPLATCALRLSAHRWKLAFGAGALFSLCDYLAPRNYCTPGHKTDAHESHRHTSIPPAVPPSSRAYTAAGALWLHASKFAGRAHTPAHFACAARYPPYIPHRIMARPAGQTLSGRTHTRTAYDLFAGFALSCTHAVCDVLALHAHHVLPSISLWTTLWRIVASRRPAPISASASARPDTPNSAPPVRARYTWAAPRHPDAQTLFTGTRVVFNMRSLRASAFPNIDGVLRNLPRGVAY
ncbi:hypothetical protein HYPSUDRAFT_219250 [Hypholoma sublateritium FD-334 SS-4]|uniref:Uncharacterized protein n=1 Tax=Hypholoma sublateritium (strain FD-334 SS-4) TaxID=945553 RepID=A0A0D2NJU6_HYPSF|nr:hypothetical protein HYPSUDRAFT_219250 [Hypholoma sublateritium FD-334 SS-4]